MRGLSEPQRHRLMCNLCDLANAIYRVRQGVDSLLSEGVKPAAIMVYSQIEWAAIDPIVYSQEANQVLQQIMGDLAVRHAKEVGDEGPTTRKDVTQ